MVIGTAMPGGANTIITRTATMIEIFGETTTATEQIDSKQPSQGAQPGRAEPHAPGG